MRLADLQGDTLALASDATIWLDPTAAGQGWYIDATPGDHAEFTQQVSLQELHAAEGPAARGVDLLTVLMHELGHIAGLEDLAVSDAPRGLMTELIAPGVRRLAETPIGRPIPAPSISDFLSGDLAGWFRSSSRDSRGDQSTDPAPNTKHPIAPLNLQENSRWTARRSSPSPSEVSWDRSVDEFFAVEPSEQAERADEWEELLTAARGS